MSRYVSVRGGTYKRWWRLTSIVSWEARLRRLLFRPTRRRRKGRSNLYYWSRQAILGPLEGPFQMSASARCPPTKIFGDAGALTSQAPTSFYAATARLVRWTKKLDSQSNNTQAQSIPAPNENTTSADPAHSARRPAIAGDKTKAT